MYGFLQTGPGKCDMSKPSLGSCPWLLAPPPEFPLKDLTSLVEKIYHVGLGESWGGEKSWEDLDGEGTAADVKILT